DDFSFKSLKYTTAGATVDGKGHFVTTRPGFSVLLFSQIQRVGRGQPREFLQVRVVHTRDWKVGLPTSPASREIGSKILDPAADAAGLGTGFVFNAGRNPRYNPFIYDASKLEGLAARNIYD